MNGTSIRNWVLFIIWLVLMIALWMDSIFVFNLWHCFAVDPLSHVAVFKKRTLYRVILHRSSFASCLVSITVLLLVLLAILFYGDSHLFFLVPHLISEVKVKFVLRM